MPASPKGSSSCASVQRSMSGVDPRSDKSTPRSKQNFFTRLIGGVVAVSVPYFPKMIVRERCSDSGDDEANLLGDALRRVVRVDWGRDVTKDGCGYPRCPLAENGRDMLGDTGEEGDLDWTGDVIRLTA